MTTGSTPPDQIEMFPYRPTKVCDSVAELVRNHDAYVASLRD